MRYTTGWITTLLLAVAAMSPAFATEPASEEFNYSVERGGTCDDCLVAPTPVLNPPGSN